MFRTIKRGIGDYLRLHCGDWYYTSFLPHRRRWRNFHVRTKVLDYLQKHQEILISLLDIGCRCGLAAIPMGRAFSKLKVRRFWGIDPGDGITRKTKRQYDRFLHCAVGEYDGEASLYVYDGNPFTGSLYEDFKPGRESRKKTVCVRRLDNIIPPSMTFDYISLNVEGNDYDILASMKPCFLEKVLFIGCRMQSEPFYKGAKLLPQCDEFLRKNRFLPYYLQMDLDIIQYYALYIRDPRSISDLALFIKYALCSAFLPPTWRMHSLAERLCGIYEQTHGRQKELDVVYKILGAERM